MQKICKILNCDNLLSPRSRLDTCPVCRGAFGRGRRNGPAWVLQRQSKLAKYTDRIQYMLDKKIVILRRRKRG